MRKLSVRTSWTLYGVAMILVGLLPFVRVFVPHWLWKLVPGFPRVMFGFAAAGIRIHTDLFWAVFLFVMSGIFVIYGIVCIVSAYAKAWPTQTLAGSVSGKTITLAALVGFMSGVAVTCMLVTVQLLSGPEKYPLDDFCGTLGAVVFYILAVVMLILYAHARRRPFVRKGLVFEIGVALFGILIGSWMLSVAYGLIEVWEDNHGYINAIVEQIVGPAR